MDVSITSVVDGLSTWTRVVGAELLGSVVWLCSVCDHATVVGGGGGGGGDGGGGGGGGGEGLEER